MMDFAIFTNGGGAGDWARGGWNLFFWHISISFNQCNNKNIIYQQFLLLFTLYSLLIVHTDVFFPSREKLTFGCKKCIFSHTFWPRFFKNTSFCREFNLPIEQRSLKKYFPSVYIKKNTKPQKVHKNVIFWKKKKNSTFYLKKKNGIPPLCT